VTPIVDADGHLDEVPDEILEYLDPPLRGQKALGRTHGLFPSWTALGSRSRMFFSDKTYSPYRSDPTPENWLAFANKAGIEQTVIYPTGALGFGQLESLELAPYIARAYNSWAYNRYTKHDERLKCVAILPLRNVPEAVKELRRARTELGMPGAVLHAMGLPKPLGDPEWWPIYEAAQDTGMFLGVHGGGQVRARDLTDGLDGSARSIVHHPARLLVEMTSMMFEGVFAEFPRLKVGFLEAGCGWVPYMMDRMDERWNGRRMGSRLTKRPSDYLRDCPVYFAAEPYESALPLTIQVLGSDHLFCASDFPHEADEDALVEHLNEWRTLDTIAPADKERIMSESARQAYSLAPVQVSV
jgi:uncharacterized protein